MSRIASRVSSVSASGSTCRKRAHRRSNVRHAVGGEQPVRRVVVAEREQLGELELRHGARLRPRASTPEVSDGQSQVGAGQARTVGSSACANSNSSAGVAGWRGTMACAASRCCRSKMATSGLNCRAW